MYPEHTHDIIRRSSADSAALQPPSISVCVGYCEVEAIQQQERCQDLDYNFSS